MSSRICASSQVAQELQQLKASGEKIVVPWSVYNEILSTPSPVTNALQLAIIDELGLAVQKPTSLKEPMTVYGGADPKTANPNQNAPVGFANLKVSGVGAQDITLIADVWIIRKASTEKIHGASKASN